MRPLTYTLGFILTVCIGAGFYNAPIQPRVITVPAPASNWAMSKPAFVPERKEIWYTDGYSGFYAIRVTNGVW